jgi:hypothetical protein
MRVFHEREGRCHKNFPVQIPASSEASRGWNFKISNSGSPEDEMRFCPWLMAKKYLIGWPDLSSSLCPIMRKHGGARPKVSLSQVTGPQVKSVHIH